MSFFTNLFGKNKGSKNVSIKKKYFEKDNMGTRQDTLVLATVYWMDRMSLSKKDPYVLYTFENKKDAHTALLELPCIHIALDTGNIICTEVLLFGYYLTNENKYEVIICGEELSHNLWKLSKTIFTKFNGKRKKDLEPSRHTNLHQKSQVNEISKVTFVREDRNVVNGQTLIYRIHKGPDATSARSFLQNNPVSQQLLYIVVETPHGNYCRDIQGIYKE